jgi:hypothetical protein
MAWPWRRGRAACPASACCVPPDHTPKLHLKLVPPNRTLMHSNMTSRRRAAGQNYDSWCLPWVEWSWTGDEALPPVWSERKSCAGLSPANQEHSSRAIVSFNGREKKENGEVISLTILTWLYLGRAALAWQADTGTERSISSGTCCQQASPPL